jgi:hypothetical protein
MACHGFASSAAKAIAGVKSWRECAEYYVGSLWFPQDRNLLSKYSGRIATSEMVDKVCRKYRLSRSFKLNRNSQGHERERYEPFARILNALHPTQMTMQTLASAFNGAIVEMQKEYGKVLISALSKTLWMMRQHPVVIYDANVRKGLRNCHLPPGDGDYPTYFTSWFSFYDRPDTKAGIDDAVAWLPDCPKVQSILKTGRIQALELNHFLQSDALRNRTTDMRLASLGGAENLFG